MGMIARNPFYGGGFLTAASPSFTWPLNVSAVARFQGIGNAFTCFVDGVQRGTGFTSSNSLYNSDGFLAVSNHNGSPVYLNWVRAYKGTTQNLTPTIT